MEKIDANIRPIPFSGGKWQYGREDGETEGALYQVKSTASGVLQVRYRDLFSLVIHRNALAGQIPVFVMDFTKPEYMGMHLPDEQWICVRLEDFQRFMLPEVSSL